MVELSVNIDISVKTADNDRLSTVSDGYLFCFNVIET